MKVFYRPDPHINDHLGGLLTEAELQQRDRRVFQHFKGHPLAWNLAGGYQVDAGGGIRSLLGLHRNTAKACLEALIA